MQNRISKKPAYEEHKDIHGEAETDKADRLWQKYLSIDNSPITDLFGGQLQSTVHCQKCKGNFTMYEPFWDLSLPIVKEGKGGIGAWLSGKKDPTSIQDCLQAFTSDELLQVMHHLLLCIAQAHLHCSGSFTHGCATSIACTCIHQVHADAFAVMVSTPCQKDTVFTLSFAQHSGVSRYALF